MSKKLQTVEWKIKVPYDLYNDIWPLIINKEQGSVSKYLIQLMKNDLKKENIKDGVAIQTPLQKIRMSMVRKFVKWVNQNFLKIRHKKYIKIDPKRNWPRQRHD